MKKRSIIILSIAAVAIITGLTLALVSPKTNESSKEPKTTPESSHQVIVYVPDVTDPPETLTTEDIRDNDTVITVSEESEENKEAEQNEKTEPVVEPMALESKVETEKKTAEEKSIPADKVETGTKEKSTDMGIDEDGDVINDKILEAKEKAEKNKEEAADKENPTLVSEEKTIQDDTKKPDVIAYEEKPDDGTTNDGKTAVDEYVPQSGEHPFVDPIEGDGGQVYSVDDLVGEDGLRPGEGIHF